MARYIMIDPNTGYIFGDSADIGGKVVTGTPKEVVAALDAHIGTPGLCEGYEVYRADVGGSEVVPVVIDGQDQDTINAVMRYCDYIGRVTADGLV